MEAFKERLVNEYVELENKYDALMKFLNSEKYTQLDLTNQMLLQQQAAWMTGYKTTLLHRITVLLDDDDIKNFTNQYIKDETI